MATAKFLDPEVLEGDVPSWYNNFSINEIF